MIAAMFSDVRATCRRFAMAAVWLTGLASLVSSVADVASGAEPATKAASVSPARRLSFNRDIRPLLSDRCFACHGPDEKRREAELRLDTREDAVRERDGRFAIAPNAPDRSQILARILSADPEEIMPPPSAKKPRFTAAEIATLKQWIAEGATYEGHWAFLPPKKVPLPAVRHLSTLRGPLDAFVVAPLEERAIAPSPPTDRPTLARRAALDITGLPVAPDLLEDFLPDQRPDAYERLVDRLLASPHYGERWGRHWLDQARYADSNGYSIDGEREMWPYRDWVINALNDDLPFDRFTVEQLAGDLLPGADKSQRIATAFHRNTLINQEGGVDREQFRTEAVIDRVNTTGAVWLGLTVGCAQCHTHKYDPLAQREYFELAAFFNSAEDANDRGPTVAVARGEVFLGAPSQREPIEPPPAMPPAQAGATQPAAALPAAAPASAASAEQRRREWETAELRRLERWIGDAATGNDPSGGATPLVQPATRVASPPAVAAGWRPLAIRAAHTSSKLPLKRLDDGSLLSDHATPNHDEYVVTVEPPQPTTASPAASNNASNNATNNASNKTPNNALNKTAVQPAADLVAESASSAVAGPNRSRGPERIMAIRLRTMTHDSLPKRGPGRAGNGNFVLTRFEARWDGQPLKFVRVWADHEQPGYGVAGLIDDNPQSGWAINIGPNSAARLNADHEAVFVLAEPLLVGDRPLEFRLRHEVHPDYLVGRFALDYTTASPAAPPADPALVALRDALRKPAANRSAAEKQKVQAAFEMFEPRAKPPEKKPNSNLAQLMVLRELSQPRPTFLLTRGDFTRPDRVLGPLTPNVPRAISPTLPAAASRLDLARWLVAPDNPLPSRVAANRIWMRLFGRGLVETDEDFGTQGVPPSHPELLDWLARDFIEHGWSVKQLQRAILTSATYRQSSRLRPELIAQDPRNVWLARQERFRVEGEIVRDLALAASGLLDRTVGGPSVRPPQPEGVYAFTQTVKNWTAAAGGDRYRRGLYTFFYRSAPYPLFTTFDAPDFQQTCTRRVRSNTPLQSLTLANDPAFLEIARGLAERLQCEFPGSGAEQLERRLDRLFQLSLGRPPAPEELSITREFTNRQHAAFAKSLAGKADSSGLSAWTDALTSAARLVMNTDNFVTRE